MERFSSNESNKAKEREPQACSFDDESGLDRVRLPFAYKLHLLLCDMESNGFEHIISWVDNGKAFKVHDQQKFEELVQPHYFRQSKMSSFIRQVRYSWCLLGIPPSPDDVLLRCGHSFLSCLHSPL